MLRLVKMRREVGQDGGSPQSNAVHGHLTQAMECNHHEREAYQVQGFMLTYDHEDNADEEADTRT
ncbi:hypothetical protein PDE_08493 [Penicillium oxalicum 114-2]|uniref:Uncharacterized protein n=1 Tax=Penicillium oxalicum (strain 114-2 / CGMCC 5302) TaxID=933388 RepID=S7ZXM8_PENO1|nr:hypothetical protein PDE_08493 [Penicillium oxalicum 114-2]